jgi:hypothetical protein
MPLKLIHKLPRLNGMGCIGPPTKKGWAMKSAGMLSNGGGVSKKSEVDEAHVGSMVPDMWLTTLLSAVGVARAAETKPNAPRALARQPRRRAVPLLFDY